MSITVGIKQDDDAGTVKADPTDWRRVHRNIAAYQLPADPIGPVESGDLVRILDQVAFDWPGRRHFAARAGPKPFTAKRRTLRASALIARAQAVPAVLPVSADRKRGKS
jgi:hypothetical protein